MKYFYIFFLTFSCLLSFTISVSAHVLETNNTVGAVMHINPDDNPIAGKESTFIFSFKDKEGKFSSENCDCIFQILRNNTVLYSQTLFQSVTNSKDMTATISYTFPEKNTYVVSIIGKPLSEEIFVPFTLTYTIPVEKNGDQKTEPETSIENNLSNYTPWMFLFSIVLLVGAIISIRHKKKLKNLEDNTR